MATSESSRMTEVIRSIKHPAVVAARESAGESGAATSYLIEGAKLMREAMAVHAPIERVFFVDPLSDAEDEAVWKEAERAGLECWLVTRGVFSRILGLGYQTSTRVLATIKIIRPPISELINSLEADRPLLIGERIQDPRNVGVLIRTAEAWGLKAVAFTEGSADPFSRPSVRSSTGSILRLHAYTVGDSVELLTRLREKGLRLIGASASANNPCWQVAMSYPFALVVGNETTGLSAEARQLCDVVTHIPMYGGAHSFNVTVAAGILLYEAARQREMGR